VSLCVSTGNFRVERPTQILPAPGEFNVGAARLQGEPLCQHLSPLYVERVQRVRVESEARRLGR
jgi:hypothetical protein